MAKVGLYHSSVVILLLTWCLGQHFYSPVINETNTININNLSDSEFKITSPSNSEYQKPLQIDSRYFDIDSLNDEREL